MYLEHNGMTSTKTTLIPYTVSATDSVVENTPLQLTVKLQTHEIRGLEF